MSESLNISVGLTGIMGSGKTEAADYFKRAGYPVLFMDQVGHACLREAGVIKRLVEQFGNEILDRTDTINRKKLSTLVFNDPKKLKILNNIMHPKMNQKAKQWIALHFKQGQPVVFIEAAVLFEMQMNKFLDYTVLIKASEKDIIDRIIKRDQKTVEEIHRILITQETNEDQVDYVINNDGSLVKLFKRCDELLKQLKRL